MRNVLGLLLTTLIAFAAAGCTFDGVGFDDPKGEVSVVGDPFETCQNGATYLFGSARNTGELEVSNVLAFADVFDGGGAFLGRFESPVSGGVQTITIDEGEEEEEETEVDIILDTLEVDAGGTFEFVTGIGCGRVARVEYTFTFTVATFEEI